MSDSGRSESRFDPMNLPPGQILGSRYRIIELIGAGGMGVVYRARDMELNVDVALKLLRSDFPGDEKTVERMKNELLLARQVSHRNVVRIHDLVIDEAGAGLKYISMAYIEGESLRRILQREGKLPVERAVALMLELCAGLEAAHEVGVLHRDFKPENILVDVRGQAFITDFGVARSMQATGGQTKTGTVVGTLQYMSPEQARGEKLDQRSDLYSFGLVAYEMLTGHLSHESETTLEFVSRILGRQPGDPREINAAIPAYLAEIVMRCLEPEPALRYGSAGEVAQAIKGQRAGSRPFLSAIMSAVMPRVTWSGSQEKRRILYLAGGSLLLASILLAGFRLVPAYFIHRESAVTDKRETILPERGSVVVLPFLNRSSDPQLEWMRTALEEILISELSRLRQLRVPRADDISQLLSDLKLSDEAARSEGNLRQVARFLSCDRILAGSFARVGNDLAFEIKLYNTRAGALVEHRSFKRSGAMEKVLETAAGLAPELRKEIDPSLADKKVSFEGMTSSTTALKNYAVGIEGLRQGAYGKAVEHFQEAVQADPKFVAAYARMSEAYDQWGHQDEAKKAYELAVTALKDSGRDHLLDTYQLRAQYALLANDLDGAIQLYKQAAETYPHNAEIYRALGNAYERKGEAGSGIASYEKAAALEPNNFRVRLALGKLYVLAHKYDNAIEQLGRALAASEQLNNDQGRADALNALGIVHRRKQRLDDAERYFLASLEIRRKIGDKRGVAVSLQNIANLYSAQAKYPDAEKKALEALKIFEELDNQKGVSDIMFNLGHLYQDTGRFQKALDSFRRALSIASPLGDVAFLAQLHERIGQIYFLLGQYPDAETYHKQALAEREGIGDEEGVLRSFQGLGDTYLEQARLKDALARHHAAIDRSRRLGYAEATAVSTSQMGLVYQLSGRYQAALDSYEEAQGVFTQLGIEVRLAEIEKRLASLYLEIGDAAHSREHLQKALAIAAKVRDQALISEIASIEGELLLADGKIEAAREAFQRALAAAQKSGFAKALIAAEISIARLECLYGSKEKGKELLKKRLDRAEEMGQAEAIARCLVYLMRVPEEKIGPAQTSRWFEKLREFELGRYELEFSLLAAQRAMREGRKKQTKDYQDYASSLFETLSSGLSQPLRESFRRAFQN